VNNDNNHKFFMAKSPFRIGIGGGGTDLDTYCNKHTGYILNATISKYAYCKISASNNQKIIFKSKDLNQEMIIGSDYQLKLNGHMDLYKATYNRIVKDFIKKPLSFELETFSEIPQQSGLGGSSTIVVTMIKAFDVWLNLNLSKKQIAKLAFEIEREDVGIVGGAQDQYTASYGGINFMKFYNNKKVEVKKINLQEKIINNLEESMILFYTKISRETNQIEEEKKAILNSNKSLESMHRLKENALKLKNLLEKGDINSLGILLHESWKNKKSISSLVSNNRIDSIYNGCLNNGALGGKISGAGGGGFMFLVVNPSKKKNLVNLINSNFGDVYDFKFEFKGATGWIE
jgi:D-glycero-alpha-D-manno-heptose-7-phosphate kinase